MCHCWLEVMTDDEIRTHVTPSRRPQEDQKHRRRCAHASQSSLFKHAAHYTHLLARHCFNALDCITEEVGGPPSATHFNAAQPALLANERERASEGGREVLEIDVDHSDCGKGVSGGKRQGRANERGRAITALLSRKDALCTHASPPPSTPQSSRLESSSSLPPQCNSGASRLCYVHIPLRSALGGAV